MYLSDKFLSSLTSFSFVAACFSKSIIVNPSVQRFLLKFNSILSSSSFFLNSLSQMPVSTGVPLSPIVDGN